MTTNDRNRAVVRVRVLVAALVFGVCASALLATICGTARANYGEYRTQVATDEVLAEIQIVATNYSVIEARQLPADEWRLTLFAWGVEWEHWTGEAVCPLGYAIVLRYSVDGEAMVTSVGPNGIDEAGMGDDWRAFVGPRLGFAYKACWVPAGAAGVLFVVVMIVAIVWSWGWTSRTALAVCAVVPLGLIVAGIVDGGGDVLRHGSFARARWPGWMTASFWTAVAWLVVASFVAIGVGLRSRVRERFAERRGRCWSCGYDLRGLKSSACPECGASGLRQKSAGKIS